jgi:putative membrane protein
MDQWWPMPWFPMFPILFMVVALVFCWFIMTTMMSRHGPWPLSRWREDTSFPHQRALNILNERFARGEIDKSEYDERRRTISQSE